MHLGPWKIMPSWTASSAVMMKYRVISTGTEACLFQIFLALPHWDSDMLVIGYLQGASLGLGDI